jgi:UDP-glucose 4-epimerase
MNILVTGGAGYVGSTVATKLLEAGHNVTIIDNLSRNGRLNLPAKARFIQADVKDLASVISADDKIDAVMHFAAFIAAGESVKQPEIYWQNNTVQSLSMLNAMRQLGIRKLIFSSTAAVYGNPQHVPITEDEPTKPTNPYGSSKLAIDMAVESECTAYGLAATSLRYFNVAGSYKTVGERHDPETHIIPLALKAAAEKQPNFTIFGNDYPTSDGTCVRDYIHVGDLASAHLLALEHLEDSKHTVYNLGNGNGFSNRQIVEAVSTVTGATLDITFGPRREGDPATLIASSDKARNILGWQPQVDKIDDIIADAWRFYQSVNR